MRIIPLLIYIFTLVFCVGGRKRVSHHEYIIVGAGPGGLQLGRFLQQTSRDYLILDRSPSVGSSFDWYPRHRQLISINKKYAVHGEAPDFLMRHDWNSILETTVPSWVEEGDRHNNSPLLMQNFTDEYYPNASHLVKYLHAYYMKYRLRVRLNHEVTKVERDTNGLFHLTTQRGTAYTCTYLVWGIGLEFNDPWGRLVGNGTTRVIRYSDLDRHDVDRFKEKYVVIIGKGNSAMETAKWLMPYIGAMDVVSRKPIRRAVESHYTGDVRIMNDDALGAYLLKSLVSIIDDERFLKQSRRAVPGSGLKTEAEFTLIPWKDGEPDRLTAEIRTIDTKTGLVRHREGIHVPGNPPHLVILCTGFRANTKLLRARGWSKKTKQEQKRPVDIDMQHQGRFPNMKPWYESTNENNLFFIGAQMHGRDYRRGNNGFIHGFRYSIRALHRWMEQEHHQKLWPAKWGSDEPWALMGRTMRRLRTTSGLYQMFGVMCDVFLFGENVVKPSVDSTHRDLRGGPRGAAHIEEIPCDLIPQLAETRWRPKGKRLRFITVLLDYDRCYKDESVFLATRPCFWDNPGCYSQANFIHPIIRFYDVEPNDDMRQWSEEKLEYGATREFHNVEDLQTHWGLKHGFWEPTRVFFERLDVILRNGAVGDGKNMIDMDLTGKNGTTYSAATHQVPVMMQERDTWEPLPDCRLERMGDLLFSKAEEIKGKQEAAPANRNEDDDLQDWERNAEFDTHGNLIRRKQVLHESSSRSSSSTQGNLDKVEQEMRNFLMAQALKFRPSLWRKLWKEMEMEPAADAALLRARFGSEYSSVEIGGSLRDTVNAFGPKVLTDVKCTTPSDSVETCLSGQSDVSQGQKKDSFARWFRDQVQAPNTTNNGDLAGTPCFALYNCHSCTRTSRCNWHVLEKECIRDPFITAEGEVITSANKCTHLQVKNEESDWKLPWPENEQMIEEARKTRIALHPTDIQQLDMLDEFL
jgi:hypothetical protein